MRATQFTFSLFATGLLFLHSADAPAQTLRLVGATVHTITGDTLTPGQVLIRDGKIAAVGATVPEAGATTIELTGQHLYPGLICLNSLVGLTEISAIRATLDATEVGEFTPDVESWISISPDSELIPVSRANGIAYFEPVPQGAIVSGQSGLVAVEGWTSEQRTVEKPVALHVFWPRQELDTTSRERRPGPPRGQERPKSLDEQAKERRLKVRALADFFDEAAAYAKAKAAAAAGGTTAPDIVPAWEAMLPFVRGDRPITIHADEIRQLKSALDWAGTNHYKIIVAGGRDAWMLAPALALKKISVIYDHVFTLPGRDIDSYDVQFKAPKVLRDAGVQVAFSAGADAMSAPSARNLPYFAAQAVAFGLPADEALKGITLYPAQIIGVADRLGSLEPGKEATLFASDGDILDIRSNVKRFWISGKEISLDSRHTRFYDKYKNRPRAN
jgi:imidazolonepropionase-like amidohydrolase